MACLQCADSVARRTIRVARMREVARGELPVGTSIYGELGDPKNRGRDVRSSVDQSGA